MTKHLNLMSEQARLYVCIRSRLRLWLRISAASVSVFVLLALICFWPANRASQHRASLEDKYEPIRVMKDRNESLDKKIKQIREQEDFTLALNDRFPMITMLGLVSQAVNAGQQQLFLNEMDFDLKRSFDNQKNPQRSLLRLDGLCLDRAAVTQFNDSLQSAIPFVSIELESITSTEINAVPMHTFTIYCLF